MKFPHWPNPTGYRNIKLGLERVKALLERLENPHLKLPPVIHIAGTNGKGSTLSFLKAIFEENGYKVHCYTSPHLVNFNERIILQGLDISDKFLNEVLEKCRKAAEIEPKIGVTFFEGITVAAFLAFAKVKADVLLLETGMGGNLDSTNVITKNLLSIITPISLDHTEFLGETLDKIAYEKAGIIKENCPVIVSKQQDEALKVIKKKAREQNSGIKIFDKDWKIEEKSDGFIIKVLDEEISFPKPILVGKHQLINASVAIISAMIQTKLKIDLKKTKIAITKAVWKARLQKISEGKFYDFLAKNLNCDFELILDGSHNEQGAQTILSWLKDEKEKTNYFVFAMLKDKDCQGFLEILHGEIDELLAITIPDESKSLEPQEILEISTKLKIKSQKADGILDALQKISQNKNNKKPIRIIVCGSLYLAGNFLEKNSIQQ